MDLALALQLKEEFALERLHWLDQRYFDTAMALLKEWRFDHYIASRSKLIDMLMPRAMGGMALAEASKNRPELSPAAALAATH